MKRRIICLLTGMIFAAGMAVPTASFAVPKNTEPINPYGNTSDSTEYEYYDENGQLIDDSDETTGNEMYAINPDTSWFDYEKPKKEYTCYSEAQLLGLASLVNEQQLMWKPSLYETFEGVTFKLARGITLSQQWTPIGNDDYLTFKGVFDGQGHAIRGLDIDETGNYVGFFGYLSGTCRNLTLQGKIRATGGQCGAVAGYLAPEGRILQCNSEVRILAKAMTGGIVGENHEGTVWKCMNRGSVRGSIKVGGIVGENWGKVLCCGNRGKVTSTDRGMTTFGTGGVAGRSVSVTSRVNRCYNAGDVTSVTEGTGGIVGYTNTRGANISSCYNTGTISVKNPKTSALDDLNSVSSKGYAGGIAGIVGTKGVRIRNCYSVGNILNTQVCGGIIGKYENASKRKSDNYIDNNYFTSQNTKYGVGVDNKGKSRNISRGTTVTSTAALISGAINLGPYYVIDPTSAYSNHGLPVLNWQKPLAEGEVEYLTCIPISTQQYLNEYDQKSSKEEKIGGTIMMFFNHYEFTSKSIGEFNNAN